jgi:cytochrome c oxidase accessory protein FixG
MNNEGPEEKLSFQSKRDLHAERLATTDESGKRVYLYPEDVTGFWKTKRDYFYWALIIVYLVIPWIYINKKPFLQIDIFNREFSFIGYTWHGVEPIFIFLTLVTGLFFIAFMTSLFGRVWCGWACPQTVFIQSIFMKIEQFIEGGARKRRDLDRASMSFEKFLKKTIKWLLFTAISLHIAHTFAGYIVGPRELFMMSMHSPLENFGVFIGIMIFTTIILLDFGWFREQFCIIACPYGRMQSVLMDNNSLIVAYDPNRGEPRRGTVPRDQEGDCINCYNCVKVCPTGIDIRRGTQLECIACTQCIDACDEIMVKIKKPTGLIRYSSENQLRGGTHKWVTPRSILYIVICLCFFTALGTFLSRSGNLTLQFYRGQESPFQITKNPDGSDLIINHFTLKVTHQGDTTHLVDLKVQDPELSKKIEITTIMHPLKFDRPENKTPVFFKFNPSILQGGINQVKLEVLEDGKVINTVEVPLVGPNR